MNLDFSALSQPVSEQSVYKMWGQAGTLGTQASVRVSAIPSIGDRPGTSGDHNNDSTPSNTDSSVDGSGFLPTGCPQVSPSSPQTALAHGPNRFNVSPMSPLVPSVAGNNGSSGEFDLESIEERAAIMEFDGGMSRPNAEAAALALIRAAA